MTIYYVPSYKDFEYEEQYGLFYLPEILSVSQRIFLKMNLKYIEVFPDLVIGQYNSLTDNVESVCEFDKEKGLTLLRKMTSIL